MKQELHGVCQSDLFVEIHRIFMLSLHGLWGSSWGTTLQRKEKKKKLSLKDLRYTKYPASRADYMASFISNFQVKLDIQFNFPKISYRFPLTLTIVL